MKDKDGVTMNAKTLIFVASALWFGCTAAASAQQAAPAIPDRLKATIDIQQTAPPVSKYLYGQFIEHIGGTMYGSLWAEMVDDRKFFFPVTVEKPAASAVPAGSPFSMKVREWHPVGPVEMVVMDKEKPFVGDQSPRIALDAATPHGVRQTGIAVVKDK